MSRILHHHASSARRALIRASVDGPDPGADLVGYTEAQVLPLRQLTISDATLHRTVLTLASAYETFSTSGTSTRATSAQAVTKAENEVNKICPQAAQ